jgi:hypothetical protein
MSESFRFAPPPQYSIVDKSEIRLNAAAIAAPTDPGVRSRLVDLRPEVFPREQLTPEAQGRKQRHSPPFQKAEVEEW